MINIHDLNDLCPEIPPENPEHLKPPSQSWVDETMFKVLSNNLMFVFAIQNYDNEHSKKYLSCALMNASSTVIERLEKHAKEKYGIEIELCKRD